ncbi:MAG: hypothetical protein KAH20_07545 [Methylococcales bacterium]|nr:hypothetical protein [Methylococcales bacterium]
MTILILFYLNTVPFVHAKGLKTIEKPDFLSIPILKPRIQTSVPTQFKEIPFVDDAPEPVSTKQEQNRGYILFNRPITQVVYPTSHPREWERSDNLSAFATPDEYEPMTFSLYPLRDMKDVRIKVSTLQSEKAKIEADNLDLRLLTNWNIRYPRYKSKETYRSMPELLEKANTVNLTKKISQRFWLKIHVPADAVPGIYQGHITIYEKGKKQGTQLPLSLRVLNYKLLRDPKKRYSVYYYGQADQFNNLSKTKMEIGRENDLKSMLSYGIDMFPTVSLRGSESKFGQLGVRLLDDKLINKMLKMGFKGPIPIDGGIGHYYRRMVKGGEIGHHWSISKLPTDNRIYKAIEQGFRNLKSSAAKKGWPELIAVPMDEPSPSSVEFASKVYAAVRRSGIKTYITKDPTSHDAPTYRNLNAIDAWSSQPFSMPYSSIMADKKSEYWSYPNHIAGEIKDHAIMQKGGRMTYGFGLWRSGYTTLIPWHWRWVGNDDDHFDYLRGHDYSGTGMRMDENLQVIPAVYWEAFREGYDDLRYLYTLQQVIVQRENSNDERYIPLINEARGLVQEIWDSIIPQKKYLRSSMWSDESFNAWRWKIAMMTQALLKLPPVNNNQSPSVIANTTGKIIPKDANQLILENLPKGNIDQFDLAKNGYKNWKAINSEVALKVLESKEKPILALNVNVDHLTDGGGEQGKHPIGWPRTNITFNKGQLDLSDYDYLYFRVNVNSNRSEVADDVTKFIVNFTGYGKGVKHDVTLDFGDKERTWVPVVLSLKDMIKSSNFSIADWSNLKHIQLVLSESQYKHGTQITFKFSDLALLKFNRPIIQEIESSPFVILPKTDYLVKVKGFGFSDQLKKDIVINANIVNEQGLTIINQKKKLSKNPFFNIYLDSLKVGKYKLNLTIIENKNSFFFGHEEVLLSQQAKTIEVINGFME